MKSPEDLNRDVINTCICPECHSDVEIRGGRYQCLQCRQVFENINGIPNFLNHQRNARKIIELSELYDRTSTKHKDNPKSCGYSGQAAFNTRLMILKKWFNIDQLKGTKILDVGCGAGLLSECLVAQNKVWGVDISLSLLIMAQQNGLKAILSSADSLPFRNNDFDIILCIGVLPYYREPAKIISEICRTIKPNGKIMISSSANSFMLRFVRWVKNTLGVKSQLERLYTYKELEEYLESEGIATEDSCIGYSGKIWSFTKGPMNIKQKILGRTVAVLGEAKPNP